MALRVPMFFKFLTGCLVLATIIIVGGAVIVHKETKMKSRGPYLVKHFKRYLNYQEGLGNATATLGAVLADDERLKAALGDSGTARDDAAVPSPNAAPPIDRVAKSMARALAGKKHIEPDVFVIVSKQKLHKRSWTPDKSPLALEDLENLPPVHKVLEGYPFANKIFVHNGKAYQLAGAPIRADDDERVLGGVIIGIDIARYMGQYKQQSDKKEAMQHRLSLVHGDTIAASVMPKDSWPELATKLKQETFVTEGEFQRRITKLKGGDFDVYAEQIDGFADDQGRPPKLFILRSRSNLKGRGAVIPWMNIWIGAGLSVLIASLLALWITRPIKQFVRQSRDMLAGGANLKQRVELSTRDETRDLADNINQVFSRLFGLASEVQSAAFQVGASSAEISAASKQMLEGLRDQTFKIESSTAAVTELSASIQQVADNAAEATEAAQKSNVAVGSAVQTMQQIRSSVEAAAGKMADLDESSKRIGNIVEVIRQISEQTSLLALNASIEAAHAGEQGRGFAVVADEVSSLAKRVGQSAKDIETLIQTIKEQTSDAVQSMDIGTREVEGGTQLVTTTLQDLQQLIHVVGDTAAAVLEQAQVSDEIARNMDAVQKIAAELVHGSEEAVQQGDQLHSLAFALEQSVGGFNVDDSATPHAPPHPALSE